MIDRENVIKALEICVREADFSVCVEEECPYIGGSKNGNCITNLERDALALLKEQEAVEPTFKQDEDGVFVWVCGSCGACMYHIYDGIDKAKEYAKYCRQCGRKVKWDGFDRKTLV